MILKTFAYHKPSPEGLAAIAKLRSAFSEVANAIDSICPPSRERSVAITELETAAMWAVKAVVFNDSESVVNPD